ncbi:hypothetical protein niasHT_003899 [Heterodera trifolii]|uniref:Uncharacterized protein n=1 Tax=Heterodera trifolii TaxID=157864 RepID=A0ABD2LV76_9BILA
MFTSSHSFDNISRFISDFVPSPNSPSLRSAFSKSESAIETPTTTSDERHSSPCSSISKSSSRSPLAYDRIEHWQSANETPIWQKERKLTKTLRFTINKTEEENEEKGRSNGTQRAPSSSHCLSNQSTTEQQQGRNGEGLGGRIVLVFRKYKIGDPESTV